MINTKASEEYRYSKKWVKKIYDSYLMLNEISSNQFTNFQETHVVFVNVQMERSKRGKRVHQTSGWFQSAVFYDYTNQKKKLTR